MDPSVLSGLSAGGLGGVVVAITFILYKCCQNKKIKSECCGGKLDVAEEPQPQSQPQSIVIQHTPTIDPMSPKKERRVSVLEL